MAAEPKLFKNHPICPENYPDCVDQGVIDTVVPGLDESLNEPLILDDYRVDKNIPDYTSIQDELELEVEPPTKRSIREGLEILANSYCDDDPNNQWLYEDPVGPFISLVTQREWGAIPVKTRQPLKIPVKNVRFTYTGTETYEYPTCFHVLKQIQKKSIEEDGLSNLPYNFLIGEDGFLYEGRGWYVDTRPDERTDLKGNCLDIAYIGDFKDKPPPWLMVETGLEVIRHGLQIKVISPDYKVLPWEEVNVK